MTASIANTVSIRRIDAALPRTGAIAVAVLVIAINFLPAGLFATLFGEAQGGSETQAK